MNTVNKIINNLFIIITWLIWIFNLIIFIIIWDFFYYINTNKSYLNKSFIPEYNKVINKMSNNIKILEIKNSKTTIKYVVSINTIANVKIFIKNWKIKQYNNIEIKDALLICRWLIEQKKKISKIEIDLLNKNKKILRKIIYKGDKIKHLLWL